MQLEAKEPTHRAFSSLNYAFENLKNMYSLVFADTQWCAVNEAICRRLGISKRTLQSYRDTGKIPFLNDWTQVLLQAERHTDNA